MLRLVIVETERGKARVKGVMASGGSVSFRRQQKLGKGMHCRIGQKRLRSVVCKDRSFWNQQNIRFEGMPDGGLRPPTVAP